MVIWFEIIVISLLFSISITTYGILKKIDKNKIKWEKYSNYFL